METWVLEIHINVKNLSFTELEALEEKIADLVKEACPEPGQFSIGGGIVPEELSKELELADEAFIDDIFADRKIYEQQELTRL